MSGLKYGQYLSQYDVREIAAVCPSNVQVCQVQEKRYYLVGTNDQRASNLLKLEAIEYDSKDVSPSHTKKYLGWIKAMLRRGFAPTITVFMNQYMFYGSLDINAGYPDYDHIVSATSVDSDYDDDEYHDEDVITFDDHGLYGPWPQNLRPFYFSYTFKEAMGDRQYANSKTLGNVYTVPAVDNIGNYGITHTGPCDLDKVLFPVRIETNVNFEEPEIRNGCEDRPEPMQLTLNVTVSGLVPGHEYFLYRYDDENKVPTFDFNAFSANALQVMVFNATSAVFTLKPIVIMSNEKVFFRAVQASAS